MLAVYQPLLIQPSSRKSNTPLLLLLFAFACRKLPSTYPGSGYRHREGGHCPSSPPPSPSSSSFKRGPGPEPTSSPAPG